MVTTEIDWKRIALTDYLTQIPNRRALDFHLEYLLECGKTVSLAVVDIDFFKEINDSLGHLGGDLAIKNIAHSLESEAIWLGCEYAMVSRFGGDEFVFVADLPPEKIGEIALFAVHKAGYKASIGIAYGDPTKALFEEADKAVYDAKRLGRNRYVYFAK